MKISVRNTLAFVGLIGIAAVNCMLAHETGFRKGRVDGLKEGIDEGLKIGEKETNDSIINILQHEDHLAMTNSAGETITICVK